MVDDDDTHHALFGAHLVSWVSDLAGPWPAAIRAVAISGDKVPR